MSHTSLPASLAICVLGALVGDVVAQEPSRYRMEGLVTEEGTQQPIAGATVQVLIESERNPENKVRSAQTDASGRYSIALPIGHGWSWQLQPPAGYAPVRAYDLEQFATTGDQPVFKKDYQVRKGIAWQVEARPPAAALPLAKTFFSVIQQRDKDYFSAYCELAPNGRASVTFPLDAAGEFNMSCGDVRHVLSAPEGMTLKLDKGFRPDRVTEVSKLDSGDTRLRDDEGRTATLHGATAEVKDGAALLVIDMKVRPEAEFAPVTGRVVDARDQPLAGAEVEAAFHAGQGSAMSSLTATTDAAGRFRLLIPKSPANSRVSLVVTKDGHAGRDTEPRQLDFTKSAATDFGSIKLRSSAAVAVRVVSSQGQPLAGAVVEPSGSYAARSQIARTDAEGMCLLKDLAPGVEAVTARFGTQTASTKLPLVAGDNELLVLKLSSPRAPPAVAAVAPEEKRAKALAAGTPAPAWEIAQWTDGQARKLADFRGKVVVLDFWGVWCGPCVQAIPAMKQLHERYKDQDVVFFGIHTAGTDMPLIQRLLKQQEWQTVSGLDAGDDIVSGATVRAYRVEGFPTLMVIDRQGNIAFNSGDVPADRETFMKQMEQDAKALGLPWPLDKDADEEELLSRLTRLQIGLYSRQIDKALAIPRR